MTIDAYYAAMSDRNDRIDATRPHVYGGNVAVASLRAFRRYDRNATYDIPDAQGVLRWVTAKQLRVYGIIARISLSPDGRARMIDIAVEAQCHTSTVSRTILKVQAWGLYAVDVRRGRNGGITVFKPFGTWAAAYVRAARQRLREMAIRARIKLASLIQRGDDMVTDNGSPINDVMDASFSLEEQYERDKAALKARLRAGDEAFNAYQGEFVRRKLGSFGVKVWEERRRLAIEDPAGEGDAVVPLWGYSK